MTAPRLAQSDALNDLLLYRISHLLSVAGAPVIRLCEGRFGITRREWRVLALLAQEEGLLSSQLAERAQLDRARTSKAITSLVSKRLLLREQRPSDRRQVRIVLTEEGRGIYQTLFPLVLEINQGLLLNLSENEVRCLDGLLDALQQRAEILSARPGLPALPKADRRRGGRAPRGLG